MVENRILGFGKLLTKCCKSAFKLWIITTPFTWVGSFGPTGVTLAREGMLCIICN